jgi:hypothetical protein
MKIYKEINQHFSGNFRLLDFERPHCQLLLRSDSIVDSININHDLLFKSVHYFELSRNIVDMHITNGDEGDWKYINSRCNVFCELPPNNLLQLFKILSDGKIFFILAACVLIDTNSLLPDQSSILHLNYIQDKS